MNRTSVKVVPLARVVREHGLPKQGVRVFKAELFVGGGLSFQGQRTVWISSDEGTHWEKLVLEQEPAPMGGAFGAARGVLLAVADTQSLRAGDWVGMARSDFPQLEPGEVYLQDLLGLKIRDGSAEAIVTGFDVQGPRIIVLCRDLSSGVSAEIPWEWISSELNNQTEGLIEVEGWEQWKESSLRALGSDELEDQGGQDREDS